MKNATSENPTHGPRVRVVCAIIEHPDDTSRYLVARRSEHDRFLAGKWEFPGGKIEAGEDEASALIREIFEELKLQIRVKHKLGSFSWQYPHGSIELIAFLSSTDSIRIVPSEHQTVSWSTLEQMQQLDWADADVPVVQALMKWTHQQSED